MKRFSSSVSIIETMMKYTFVFNADFKNSGFIALGTERFKQSRDILNSDSSSED